MEVPCGLGRFLPGFWVLLCLQASCPSQGSGVLCRAGWDRVPCSEQPQTIRALKD